MFGSTPRARNVAHQHSRARLVGLVAARPPVCSRQAGGREPADAAGDDQAVLSDARGADQSVLVGQKPWDALLVEGEPAGVGVSEPAEVLGEPPWAATGVVTAMSGSVGSAGSGPRRAGARVVGRLLQRWVPATWQGARLDPGRPAARALMVVAALAALVAAGGVWLGRPVPEPVPPLAAVTAVSPARASRDLAAPGLPDAPSAPGARGRPAAAGARPTELVVSVVGKVARPGLVKLAEGARVADALAAAGGASPGADLADLNLARRLSDGDQVAVGIPTPDASAPRSGTASGPTQPGAKVNLNTATAQQLDTLPGVGPVTVERILDWRAKHGRFASVDQLREVSGIGPARFAQLRDLVTV